MNSQGQSSVEAAVCAAILILMVQLTLAVAFYSSLRMFIDYRAHEAMVCASQGGTEFCRQRLKQEVEKFLVFGKMEYLTLTKSHERVSVQIFVRFPPFAGSSLWKFKDRILLPLKS